MSDLPIALWAMNLGFAPKSPADYVSHVEKRLAEAAEKGAKILVLPEYAVEACLAFKPDGLAPNEEIAFMAKVGEELLPALKPLAAQYGVSLLAGSLPISVPGGFTNSAVLFTADGREIRHDKLSLTPGEKDENTWKLTPGGEVVVFDLEGVKTAMLICLDIEMPALSMILAGTGVELLLIPSMTEKLSGYHRVFDCAKARAVELMCAVAVCGTVGASKGTTQMDTNVSGAALFVPCEAPLGFTGVVDKTAVTDGTDGQDPVLYTKVPVEIIRSLRKGGAEVWPGGWSGEHVKVVNA